MVTEIQQQPKLEDSETTPSPELCGSCPVKDVDVDDTSPGVQNDVRDFVVATRVAAELALRQRLATDSADGRDNVTIRHEVAYDMRSEQGGYKDIGRVCLNIMDSAITCGFERARGCVENPVSID